MNASSTSVASSNGNPAKADLLREQQAENNRLQLENTNLIHQVAELDKRLENTRSPYIDEYEKALQEASENKQRLEAELVHLRLKLQQVDHQGPSRATQVASSHSTHAEDFEAELLQKRAEIEEKDAKIRQQKEAIMRAVAAIEQLRRDNADLQSQLERARAQSNQIEEMEAMRHVLAKTQEESDRRAHRVFEVETALATANEDRASVRARFEEANETKQRVEAELIQLRQQLQQIDQQRAKGEMEVEHLRSVGNQRDKQLEELSGRLEQMTRDKQHTEAKYQAHVKQIEGELRAQMEKLKEEGDKYRNEYMKVNSERDKLQYERERFVAEFDTVKQDKARYQAEWERVAKDMDRLTGEATTVRLQNAKLSATWEHQGQTLENYRSERESALDSLHKLESEVAEWRKLSADREVTAKTQEMRSQHAEAEVKRLQERLEAITTRNTHTANERLMTLEQSKNSLESQNYELRKHLSSLQHQVESLQSKCQTYEAHRNEEADKVKQYKEHLAAAERELRQRMDHGEQLEHELAQLKNSSVFESARMQQSSEQIKQATNERNQFKDSLQTERARLEAAQKTIATLEAQNQQLAGQFMALAREIQGIVGFEDHELNDRSLDALLKEAKSTLQRQFKAEADVLVRRWQEGAEASRGEVDRLSSKLHSCHMKLESLQRTTLHAKDDAKSIDRSWLKKYENLRSECESYRRSLEEGVRSEKIKSAQLEASLSQARREIDAMVEAKTETMSGSDILYLQESNRFLVNELHRRRACSDRYRELYANAVAEMKDMLNAKDILKNGINERDKYIESLKVRNPDSSMLEVEQKLLEQLEETQAMISEMHMKISNSRTRVAEGPGWVVHLAHFIGRLEVVCDRSRESTQESRETHYQVNEGGPLARSLGKNKKRQAWVDEIQQKCDHQLSESIRLSEWMRDIVESIIEVLEHARSRKKIGPSPQREDNASEDAASDARAVDDQLTSLRRIGDELKSIEGKIKTTRGE